MDNFTEPKYVWIVLNSVLFLYVLIIFLYGSCCGHKNHLRYVILLYNYLINIAYIFNIEKWQ